jgi:hypothetical protein
VNRKNFCLALILAILGITDQVTTWLATSVGAYELNPLIAPFLSNPFSFIVLTILKTLFIFTVAYFSKYNKPIDYIIYLFIVFIFSYVCYKNYMIYLERC